MTNHDPLKVDSNCFNDDSNVYSSKVLSYVQVTKKVDKSILTVDFEAKTSKRLTIGDIGSILVMEIKIKKEEVMGIQRYYFGATKGCVKI